MASGSNSLSLARFAFNIYGSLSHTDRPLRQSESLKLPSSAQKNFIYSSERELTSIAQFSHPLGRLNSSYYDASSFVPSMHVVLGGKNYLRLLVLSKDQSGLLADLNLVDPNPSQRLQLIPKLFNVNTIKCNADLIACGLTNGNVHIFQVAGNGKSKLAYRLDDHKRVVNSLDFVEMEQLLFSGSQDGSVRLWDLRQYSQKPAIELLASQHSDPVRSCQYSPFNKTRGKLTVLSVHDSGSLYKFDLRFPSSLSTQLALPERKWTFHSGPALSLHIHPESEHVLTGGRDRKICLWNYSESAASSKAPELIMNTYGPVMKIRWNENPNTDILNHFAAEEPDSRPKALYNYDFACLYLNDDPTITVYNLSRRYVPKEIITTSSQKPIQNFVWARGLNGERRLWSISKANTCVSYNLDTPGGQHANILRTQENLPVVASAWSEGYASMAFVYQNSESCDRNFGDQENLTLEDRVAAEDFRSDDDRISVSRCASNGAENVYSRSFLAARPNLPRPANTATLSPKEKSYANRHSSLFSLGAKSPSPVLPHRPSFTDIRTTVSPLRPPLRNTPSQSTIDSTGLNAMYMLPLISYGGLWSRRLWNLATPSVFSLTVPIALADDAAFLALASNYLISVPDGFSISFVCQVNAQVAQSIGWWRDSQAWNLLAGVLEQERPEINTPIAALAITVDNPQIVHDGRILDDDMKSICSELDNYVASCNSHSTLTTNYGGGPKSNASMTSMTKALFSSSKQLPHFGDFPLVLKKMPKIKGDSEKAGHLELTIHSKQVDEETMSQKQEFKMPDHEPRVDLGDPESDTKIVGDKESAVEDVPAHEPKIRMNRSLSELHKKPAHLAHCITNPFAAEPRVISVDFLGEDQSPQSRARRPYMHRGFSFTSPTNFQKIPLSGNLVSDKSSGVATNLGASPGSLWFPATFEGPNPPSSRKLLNQPRMYHYLTNHSSSSVGSFPVPYVDGFNPLREEKTGSGLDRVEETSIKSKEPVASELTKAINQVSLDDQKAEARRPWYSLNLIRRALDFAIEEGDLVTAATYILLFADAYPEAFYSSVLSEDQCLECLGGYIDALRKKEMYDIAVHVVKEAPLQLKYRLGIYACREVDMKFYCCWCQRLLVNEQFKSRYGATSENYGYWYCDECSRRQLNCIYCNEPCKGLTVVVDLVCGHRGHFGCLQEWYIEDRNIACPGGCEK